jgi:hypothetical protein
MMRMWMGAGGQAATVPDPAPKYTATEMPLMEWLDQVFLPELLPRTVFDAGVCKVFGMDK